MLVCLYIRCMIRTKLDKELLEKLYSENKSYKEIINLTGYSKSSVNGYFWKNKGKVEENRRFRRRLIDISQKQKEILFGTLLGDGNIQKQCLNSFIGRFNHSINQEIYCNNLRERLENLTSVIRYASLKNKEKVYNTCYFTLKNNYNLKEFYDMFYIGENNKKDVPLNLDLLTPEAMAYWFMDDGTASSNCSISIATYYFSIEGLLRLKNYLYSKYSIEITIRKDFKIYFKAESGKLFYNLVKEFIIPEMLYKFRFVDPLLI